jgi:hypothetical protein
MNNIPITNINKWTDKGDSYRVVAGRDSEWFWLWDSQLETVDDATLHYKRLNSAIEGIEILWDDNPFNLKKYGNTFNKVYSYIA